MTNNFISIDKINRKNKLYKIITNIMVYINKKTIR